MKRPLHEAGHFRKSALAFALLAVTIGCGEGSGTSSTDSEDGDPRGGSMPGPTDGIDESVLAKCPQSSTLIETTEWMSCLEGKRLTGTEPFNNKPCELRIGANGAFEYLRDNAVAIAVPDRSGWRGASGTYQNDASSGPRIFLAGIAPDIEPVEGEARVTNIDISLFALPGQDDTVSIRYLDEALARQTYNCTVQAY